MTDKQTDNIILFVAIAAFIVGVVGFAAPFAV